MGGDHGGRGWHVGDVGEGHDPSSEEKEDAREGGEDSQVGDDETLVHRIGLVRVYEYAGITIFLD